MISAVIFDCFGVLSTGWWEQLCEEFFSHDESLKKRARDINRAVNAGHMSYEEYLDEICRMSGLTMRELKERTSDMSPNRLLFDYIRDELKPKYKIGMLSNAASNWLKDLFEPDQVSLFDAILLSYEVGAVKPDAIMYTTVANRLGVPIDECLFIDDVDTYCQAAKGQGMQAIHHTDTNQTIAEIKEIIGA